MAKKKTKATPLLPEGEGVVDIHSLIPDAANVRRRTDKNRQAIRASLKQFGAFRSVAIDADGVIRAGNGTIEAAIAEGITRVRIVDVEGDEVVAVRRKDLSGATAIAAAIADNRSSELAEWDELGLATQLEALANEGLVPLEATGFEQEDLEAMLEQLAEDAAGDGQANDDQSSEDEDNDQVGDDDEEDDQDQASTSDGSLQALAKVSIADPDHTVKKGDTWRLGPHVLCCMSVFTDWPIWMGHLGEDSMFLPYPGPFLAVSEKAAEVRMVLVQPDPYLAGHIVDQYAAIHGEAEVSRVRG